MFQEALDYLLEYLSKSPKRRSSFEATLQNLIGWLKSNGYDGTEAYAIEVVTHALDEWLIDKIVDYPSFSNHVPIGEIGWFLKLLSTDETATLQGLKPHEQELIRILHDSISNEGLGTLHEQEALNRLKQKGFDIRYQ